MTGSISSSSLRAERVVGGRNHQADGVGDGAAQRARRIIDRIVEVCRGRSHAACDVVVFGAFAGSTRETVAMETLASAATFVIELFAEAAEAEALSVVRAMLSSPQIFEMLEKLGLFELLPYLNRVFKNKTATRRKRQVAGSKYRNHACCIATS